MKKEKIKIKINMFSYHAFLWVVMLEGKYIIESPPILNKVHWRPSNLWSQFLELFCLLFPKLLHALGVGGMVCLALDDD